MNDKLCSQCSKDDSLHCSQCSKDGSLHHHSSLLYNWAKLLRETVECWGYWLGETPQVKSFYHGISVAMMFDGFNQYFKGPTSTSLQYEVALTFANQGQGNGIIITVKKPTQNTHSCRKSLMANSKFSLEMLFSSNDY